MYRLMQPEDKPAVLALWQRQRNESEEFAKRLLSSLQASRTSMSQKKTTRSQL